jgi:hypothetical protein
MDARARQRLFALQELKRSICFCSECGKQLRYRSFSAHPCYYLAVKRYGTYKARLRVRRLEQAPGMFRSLLYPALVLPFLSLGARRRPPLQQEPSEILQRGHKRARSMSIASESTRPVDNDNGEAEAVRRGAEVSPPIGPAEGLAGFDDVVEPPPPMTLEDAEEAVMLEELEDFCTCFVRPLLFRSSS